MKNLTYYLIVILLLPFAVVSQTNSNWKPVNPNQNQQIYDLIFMDSLTGFFVTGNSLYKTVDLGETWTLCYTDTNAAAFYTLFKLNDSLYFTSTSFDSLTNTNIRNLNSLKYNSTNLIVNQRSNVNDIGSFHFDFNQKIWCIKNYKLTYTVDFINYTTVKQNVNSFNILNGNITCANSSKMYFSNDTANTFDSANYQGYFGLGDKISTHYNNSDTLLAISRGFPSRDLISFNKGQSWQSLATTDPHKPSEYYYRNSKNIIGTSRGLFLWSNNYGYNFNIDTVIYSNGPSNKFFIYQHNDSTLFYYGYNGIIFKSTNLGGITGIDIDPESLDFSVYPNPSFGTLNLYIPSLYKVNRIELYSMNGQLIKRFSASKRELDVTNISKGNYLLRVSTKEGQTLKKISIH